MVLTSVQLKAKQKKMRKAAKQMKKILRKMGEI